MYVIIIAGSLPTLRPLVQKATAISKRRSTNRKSYHQHPNTFHRNPLPLKVYGKRNSYNLTSMPTRQSSSDHDILSGITKTTDIAVDYNSRKSKSDRGQGDWEDHGDDPSGVMHAVGAIERV